ncbi:MAG TPA: MBL fold metallo-hydrolase [Miltoncostaeaceae bacterium]|nr:MBL fold metallo-hydrolase [Miltoncostaeaceae bacterium]
MSPPPARVGWAGHATVRIEIDGAALLTDPVLRRHVSHLRRPDAVDAGFAEGLDAVLLSHMHLDHLDFRSLQAIGPGPPVIAPRGSGGLLRRHGVRDVVEVVPGDEVPVGGLVVQATYADHDGRRRTGTAVGPALGYLVSGTRSVYFAGDTDLFAGMADITEDPLDLALLPVWGWGPRIGPGHLDPRRAAEALRLLEPRVAIPIHWGTYRPFWIPRSATFLSTPGPEFATDAAVLAPPVEVRVLAPGEWTVLEGPAGLPEED